MIFIQKGKEPDVFLQYRLTPGSSFDGIPGEIKQRLRESLLSEQGHLCAYCMQRIGEKKKDSVKIEHLVARTPENELKYENLLAVCTGGEGMPYSQQRCDTRKGRKPLSISPLKKEDMDRITYSKGNGWIYSEDTTEYRIQYSEDGIEKTRISTPDKDLSELLNLNAGEPIRGRLTALNEFRRQLQPYKNAGAKRQFLEKMKSTYSGQKSQKQPYVGILLWYIEEKLKHT